MKKIWLIQRLVVLSCACMLIAMLCVIIKIIIKQWHKHKTCNKPGSHITVITSDDPNSVVVECNRRNCVRDRCLVSTYTLTKSPQVKEEPPPSYDEVVASGKY